MLTKSRQELIEAIDRHKKRRHVPQLIMAYKEGVRDTVIGTTLPPIGNYLGDLNQLTDIELLAYEAFWAEVSKKCPVSFSVSDGRTLLIDYPLRELLPKGTVYPDQVRNMAISEGTGLVTKTHNNEERKTLAYRLHVILECGGNPKITREEFVKDIDKCIEDKSR